MPSRMTQQRPEAQTTKRPSELTLRCRGSRRPKAGLCGGVSTAGAALGTLVCECDLNARSSCSRPKWDAGPSLCPNKVMPNLAIICESVKDWECNEEKMGVLNDKWYSYLKCLQDSK